MPEKSSKLGFSQRHPFLFGMMLIAAVAVLLVGAAAAVRFGVMGERPTSGPLASDRFGLVNVEGFIASSRSVNDFITKLRDDAHIKGVVLRVNSPGGAVGPSQEIHRAVRKLAAIKPVVVSMGTVAASGGYYVSCSATRIVANPATLTGSIGVKMQLSNLEGLMDKLGISHASMTSGKLKDAGSPYRPMTDEERAYFKALIMDMYDQFVLDVAEGRKLDLEHIRAVADGRALTGRQARELGLVDELGGLEEAFDVLRKLTGIDKRLPVTEGPKREEPLWSRLLLKSAVSLLLQAGFDGHMDETLTGLAGVGRDRVVGPRWEFLY